MSDQTGGSDQTSHVLDLTSEATQPEKAAPIIRTIAERQEDTRRAVAMSLLVGLGLIVVAWTAIGIWADASTASTASEALRTAFTGILGLAATVVGFYFGGATKGT